MKVLLVEPPVSPYDVPTTILAMAPPHHLEIIAGALTSYHDVRILDMRIEDDFLSVISDFQPNIVGSSCVAANSHLAKSLLRQAKNFNRHNNKEQRKRNSMRNHTFPVSQNTVFDHSHNLSGNKSNNCQRRCHSNITGCGTKRRY